MSGKKNLNNYSAQKIIGRKIILRVLEKGDLKRTLAWLKDPSVNMYLSQNFCDYTEDQELKWFKFIQSSNNDIVFAIEDINTKFAMSELNLKSIKLNVYKYNRRAIKVYKKCGFKLIQTQKKNHLYNGKYWDTLIMEFKKT